MIFNKKSVPMRLFALLAVIAVVLSSLIIVPFSVSALDGEAVIVYVSPSGDDSGDGSKTAPFATLKKAFSTLAPIGMGTIVLMGDIESANSTAWNAAATAWGSRQAAGLLTITACDPETGEIYEGARLRYNGVGLKGPTKIEHIIMVPIRSSCFINTCGHEFIIGEGVYAETYQAVVHDGIGESKKNTTVSGISTTIDGGAANIIYMGGGYATNTSQGVAGDARFTMNNGSLTRLTIGFDKYLATHTTGRIDGNVIITINGGEIGNINTSLVNDNTVGGFIALIFNGNILAPYELPEANEGVFVVRGGNHGTISATDTAGVFNVIPDKGYTAYIGTTALEAGLNTFEEGMTSIKFMRSEQANPAALEKAYIDGFPDGTFRPDEPISRAEAVGLIIKASTNADLIEGKYTVSYTDISKSDWYYDAAAYLDYLEILPEAWGESFAPNKDITRAEFVHIIENIIPHYPVSSKLFDFSDVSNKSPYYNSIISASRSGCINGYENGAFGPDNSITRAEAVTVVNRYLERVPDADAKANYSDVAGHWAQAHIAAASEDISSGIWNIVSTGESYVLPAPGSGAETYVKALYEQSKSLTGDAIRAGVDAVAEQMKKDILAAPNTLDIYTVKGDKFYVSEKNGDDVNNDGRSPASPIKTIAGLSKLSIGENDAVLFERGGIYRGNIAAKNGVTYGAYGEGDKPLIMQSRKNYADPALWVETEWPNVYKCADQLINVGVIGFDHDLFDYSEDSYNELYGDIMNLNTFNFTGPADLSEDLQFYSVTVNESGALTSVRNDLYVYSAEGNPGERFKSIEIGERIDIFDGAASNCTIDNIAMKFTGGHAVGFGTCSNLTVTNCIYSWLGGSVLKINTNGSAVNYGNAVEIYGGCNGYFVENNWMYQIYDTGVTHQRSSSTGNCIQTNVRYTGNLIEYVHWGIEFYNAPPTSDQLGEDGDIYTRYTSNVEDKYNVCRMGGYGWGSVTRYRTKSARLYCGSSLSQNYDQFTHYNIFDRCAGYLINLPYNSTEDDDKNIYIQNVGCTLGLLKGVTKTCNYGAHTDIKNYLGDENAVVVVVDE